jgi:hypothetical protein
MAIQRKPSRFSDSKTDASTGLSESRRHPRPWGAGVWVDAGKGKKATQLAWFPCAHGRWSDLTRVESRPS